MLNRDEEHYRLLREAHRRSEEFGVQASTSLDKALLTLSGGAIGVSLTFLDELHDAGLSWWPLILLYGAWIAFGASILFTIWSMREAADRLAEETTFYNLMWVEELSGEISEDERAERQNALDESKNLLNKTRRSNRWARRTFYGGLITLALFGILAVHKRGGNDMGDKGHSTREPGEKKGYSGGGINPIFQPKPSQGGSGTQQGQDGSSGDSGSSGSGGGGSESEKPQAPNAGQTSRP